MTDTAPQQPRRELLIPLKRLGAINNLGGVTLEHLPTALRVSSVPTDPEDDNAALRQEVVELHRALESRTVIGQAIGILMERYKIDGERAWALLVRLSQQGNVKVRELARSMTADMTGPGAYPERRSRTQTRRCGSGDRRQEPESPRVDAEPSS